MSRIKILGFPSGKSQINAIKHLRAVTGCSLAEAKRIVDKEKEETEVCALEGWRQAEAERTLREAGFLVENKEEFKKRAEEHLQEALKNCLNSGEYEVVTHITQALIKLTNEQVLDQHKKGHEQ